MRASNAKFPVSTMVLPNQGPVAIPRNIDFTTDTSIDIDLVELVENGWVDFISGVFIDNSQNANTLTFSINGTNQSFEWPANTFGYMPLFLTNPPKLSISTGAAGDVIPLIFYNMPMLPFAVGPDNGGGAGGNVNLSEIGGVTQVGDILNVTQSGEAMTETITILTGGAGDQLVAAGAGAKYVCLVNTGAAQVDVSLSGNATAAPGIPLAPNGVFILEHGCSNAITGSGTLADVVIAYSY